MEVMGNAERHATATMLHRECDAVLRVMSGAKRSSLYKELHILLSLDRGTFFYMFAESLMCLLG